MYWRQLGCWRYASYFCCCAIPISVRCLVLFGICFVCRCVVEKIKVENFKNVALPQLRERFNQLTKNIGRARNSSHHLAAISEQVIGAPSSFLTLHTALEEADIWLQFGKMLQNSTVFASLEGMATTMLMKHTKRRYTS